MGIALVSRGLACAFAVLLYACASSGGTARSEENLPAKSDDLLTLLTGFGESISKKDFEYAVAHLTPSERSRILDAGGKVPADKKKQLQALELQRLIRMPSVRVEDGRIAGIYDLLPNLEQGQAVSFGAPGDTDADPLGLEDIAEDNAGAGKSAVSTDELARQETVQRFFDAVRKRNWDTALALVNEGERKLFLDNQGGISEEAKQRLSRMDQSHPDVLTLRDGKLVGVTLLVPSP